jgi:hypothetical protein
MEACVDAALAMESTGSRSRRCGGGLGAAAS